MNFSNCTYRFIGASFLMWAYMLAGLSSCLAKPSEATTPPSVSPHLYGILQNSTEHAAQNYKTGVRIAVVELSWASYNPAADVYNSTYRVSVSNRIKLLKNAGYTQFMLDLGLQYPPAWVQKIPNARFVNQYGHVYVDTAPGKNIVNAVFNAEVRSRMSAYIQRIFQDFGSDWQSVRLGGLWYGELHYPPATFDGDSNCFWAFDAVAQGTAAQRPKGINICPVKGWLPSQASPSNQASLFANWYLDSLKNYHDWQISEVRRWFSGNICMLYPGYGIRANELKAAIAANLSPKGSKILSTGEMQAGNDFARFISGITDSKVIVYSTHIDTPDDWSNEKSADPNEWCPLRWLGWLADKHPLRLRKWGENTGNASVADMERTFKRIRQADALGVVWAFESELYDGKHATIAQYENHISTLP